MIDKNYKYLFIEKVVLGQKININNRDEVIKKCISLAYKDMNGIGQFYIGKIKATLTNKFYSILNSENYTSPRTIIDDSLYLFGNTEKIVNSKKKNAFVTRYGLCQKLVNMTFKYLYVFSDYINLDINFGDCDCPLDSIILQDKLGKNIKWSKLTKEEYISIQDQIGKELQKDNRYKNDKELKNIGNLAYDFLNWQKKDFN